ncbi:MULTISPECIES: hypothetical protein [unclassified Paenibacillus]|uniref:hypothetical protein n=1 Tax=unclassified Paenibacillus TaxID=185978 RepID=UPI0008B21395|nr:MULTISPECIES: hypothetical protein [unclassified Paenibacillus]QLG39559.1 hypothetical protein HW560_16625 [Paenibacillus sp. E222]SEO05148.1 hypothetical protein SAMN05518670_3478 [Paenibacillus sp. OK076]
MRSRNWIIGITGLSALLVLGMVIYRTAFGKSVGLGEMVTLGAIMMLFMSTVTWGTKADQDHVREDEELGRKITEQSSKLGYFLLTFFILIAVAIDHWMHEEPSLLLLSLLGLSMVILPFLEWIQMRKYRLSE